MELTARAVITSAGGCVLGVRVVFFKSSGVEFPKRAVITSSVVCVLGLSLGSLVGIWDG